MVLLSFAVVFSSCPKILADDDILEHQQHRKALEAEGIRLNKVLENARRGKLTAADQKTAYEEKKSVIAQQLSETKNDIEDKNREIQEQEQIISMREMQLKDRKEEAKVRIKEIYKAGETCTLDCLLNTKSVSDFLDKAHILKIVSDRDAIMIENTKTTIAKLNQEKQLLEENRDELNAKKVELSCKEDEYVQMISESNDWINQLAEEEQVALRDIDNNNLQIEQIDAKIEQYYEEQRFLEEQRRREEERRKEEEAALLRSLEETRQRQLEEEKLLEEQNQQQEVKVMQTQEKVNVTSEPEQPKAETETETKVEVKAETKTETKTEAEIETKPQIETEVVFEKEAKTEKIETSSVDNNVEISTEEVYHDEDFYLPTEQVQEELNSDKKVDVYTEEANTFEEKEIVETLSYSKPEVEVKSEPEAKIEPEQQAYKEETEEVVVKNEKPAVSRSGFIWPTTGFHWLSSVFNEGRGSYRHGGVDIAGAGIYGTPILAANDGVVSTSWYCNGGWGGGYGTYCMIDHQEGKSTLYAHMSSITVSPGEHVSKGQVIGYVGTTGESTGPHLHFETRLWGIKYDPMSEF